MLDNTRFVYGKNTSGLTRNLIGINSSNNILVGYGGYSSKEGGTHLYGNVIRMYSRGSIYTNCSLVVPNGVAYRAYDVNGTPRPLIWMTTANSIIVGNSSANNHHSGNTVIYAPEGSIKLTNSVGTLQWYKYDSTTGTKAIFNTSVNNISMLGSPSYRWYRLYQTESSISTSDKREKENIKALKKVKKSKKKDNGKTEEFEVYSALFDRFEPVEYNFIEGEKRKDFGLIAQDVLEAMKELGLEEDELDLVHHDTWIDEKTGEKKDVYGIAYENIIAMLIWEVQKLKGVTHAR